MSLSSQGYAGAPAEIALSRIDCGHFEQLEMAPYDDVALDTARRDAVNTCYLIRHDDEYMIWDIGLSVGLSWIGNPSKVIGPSRSVKSALADQGIGADKIKYIGISHNHFDHLGQAADFPNAKLLIGAADWANIKSLPGSKMLNPWISPKEAVKPWLDDEKKVEQLVIDKDVFGDGSVVMLKTAGHTPGHYSVMIRLKQSGPFLLSGDLYEWRQSYENDVVSNMQESRAETLASYDRFKRVANSTKATVVIQHEPEDLSKIPAFPKWAK